MQTRLGIIGGSGVYQMKDMEVITSHDLLTPFGKPSDPIIEGKIHGRSVLFLPRHGKGHRYLPSEVPYRANIYAMKMLGVTHVLAVSAVGIMRDDIKPGDMVVPDQLFDRTRGHRANTFFGDGVVGHVSFADPFCQEMRQTALAAAKACGSRVFDGGTYIAMEGPAFSTRAESQFYRSTIGPSVIGMTAIPEAKLAREAELSYAIMATATDYDCWHENEEEVSVEAVLKVLQANAEMVQKIVKKTTEILPQESTAPSLSAARFAIMTPSDIIPPQTKERLRQLYGKYW